MKWQKLGRLFCPAQEYDWLASHATLPFPVKLDKNIYRVYFTCRDRSQRSHCAYVVMDLPKREILEISAAPVLSPGKPGYFDDAGVLVAQLVEHDHGYFAYYMAWSNRVAVPFQNAIGLATCSKELDHWEKYAEVPLLDRSREDPLSLSYPWVLKENGAWKMWYGSHLAWESNGMDMQHVIKYAESDDGINWRRDNTICIALDPNESGVSRPCVIKEKNAYRMWYSKRLGRKETYLLGYAVSEDGKQWTRRDDEAGMTVSPVATDWDSEMICYPCVFDHDGTRYMLYNGNEFGRSGFGLAVYT